MNASDEAEADLADADAIVGADNLRIGTRGHGDSGGSERGGFDEFTTREGRVHKLLRGPASVDGDGRAGDVTGGVGGEENDEPSISCISPQRPIGILETNAW